LRRSRWWTSRSVIAPGARKIPEVAQATGGHAGAGAGAQRLAVLVEGSADDPRCRVARIGEDQGRVGDVGVAVDGYAHVHREVAAVPAHVLVRGQVDASGVGGGAQEEGAGHEEKGQPDFVLHEVVPLSLARARAHRLGGFRIIPEIVGFIPTHILSIGGNYSHVQGKML
jgi:hypothetical protein